MADDEASFIANTPADPDTQAIAKAKKKLGNSTKSWFIINNN